MTGCVGRQRVVGVVMLKAREVSSVENLRFRFSGASSQASGAPSLDDAAAGNRKAATPQYQGDFFELLD